MNVSLAKKYRPRSIGELVLPARHGLEPVFNFLDNPYSSAWLFSGASGIGKTSAAEILAQRCSDPAHVRRYGGSDMDHNRTREIEVSLHHRPLFGNLHFILVDEADQITEGGQIRLLRLLENAENCVWAFTTNAPLETFEGRFLSRVKAIHFSSQGLLQPATRWLIGIAQLEGLALSENEAVKILQKVKNNLRNALQVLELRLLSVPGLPAPRLSLNQLETPYKPALQGSTGR